MFREVQLVALWLLRMFLVKTVYQFGAWVAYFEVPLMQNPGDEKEDFENTYNLTLSPS